MTCTDYVPGDKPGKERPICRYYMPGGPCSRKTRFMCEEWMKLQEKKPNESERPETSRI